LESNRHFTLRTHSDILDRLIGPSTLQMLELCFTLYVYGLWTIYMKHISADCCIRIAQISWVICYCVQSGHNRFFFFLFSPDVFFPCSYFNVIHMNYKKHAPKYIQIFIKI
jgi:hypothetical protein